jgi:hypothetical protein
MARAAGGRAGAAADGWCRRGTSGLRVCALWAPIRVCRAGGRAAEMGAAEMGAQQATPPRFSAMWCLKMRRAIGRLAQQRRGSRGANAECAMSRAGWACAAGGASLVHDVGDGDRERCHARCLCSGSARKRHAARAGLAPERAIVNPSNGGAAAIGDNVAPRSPSLGLNAGRCGLTEAAFARPAPACPAAPRGQGNMRRRRRFSKQIKHRTRGISSRAASSAERGSGMA